MKKIMIVDDEQISLMMTDHILSTSYQTYAVSSGEEAIEVYERERPDMVLSDLRMPGITGLELKRILQDKYDENIPFMFMTADRDDETESRGFENGAMDFIRKPFRADVLLRRIDNILKTVEKLAHLKNAASTDRLTGLLNKASSAEEIGFLCKSTQGVLMMIDLDSFKLVNDLYGHAAGDKLLADFADILRSAVRHNDIIGRIGGDEFIAFCQNIYDESVIAEKTASINEQLLSAARMIMGKDMNIPLGASIGCVFAPDEGSDYPTLFKKADRALYVVKKSGKHGYNLYRDRDNEKGDMSVSSSSIESHVAVLSERNRPKGGFVLSMEDFRLIFRFLCRVNANYDRTVWILLFSLKTEGSFDDHALPTDEFLEVLRSSLRQSDIITQSGRNQFMVLLLEITASNLEIVTDRILKKWDSSDASRFCRADYEIDLLRSTV
ncbi:MAG: diguanylate cyclase [Lachnospiraceae bacterium]|nr:diguanylate cyclase [Lachnospiraceae bacterium]